MVSKSNKQLGSILLVILLVVALVGIFMNMKNQNVQNDGNYSHQEQTIERETLPGGSMSDSQSMTLNAAPAQAQTNTNELTKESMTNQGCFPKEQ